MDTFVDILLDESYGWHKFEVHKAVVWFKGYIFNQSVPQCIESILYSDRLPSKKEIVDKLRALDGHFSLVIKTSTWCLAAVDRIRSIPLIYSTENGHLVLGGEGREVRNKAKIDSQAFDPNSVLMVSMSGFVSREWTLYKGLHQLHLGQALLYYSNHSQEKITYYQYIPTNHTNRKREELLLELSALTLKIHKKIVDSAEGRPIFVPLSAGLDSRCVVSALHHLGYKNVHCFSYGIPNNFESKASQLIAKELGYSWRFVPLSKRIVSQDYKSKEYADYLSFADTCASVPVVHEFSAIKFLKQRGHLPDNAIIINGMSGDYLTGSHIPSPFFSNNEDNTLSEEERKARILDSLIAKHYSLWDCLKTTENLKIIKKLLWDEIQNFGGLTEDADSDYGLYESSECANRQSKYVVSVQRIYEFFGFDWHLPLWDNDYLDFWEVVPLEMKKNRILFRQMLEQENWGGVWKDWHFQPFISPRWIHLFRLPMKLLFVALPRERWKAFDHRVFHYWIENLQKNAIVPYYRVLFDNRGYRDSISWVVEHYLNEKGLSLDRISLKN